MVVAQVHTKRSSMSASVGIGISFASGTGFGVMASASQGKGQGDGNETTHSNTHINAGKLIQIDSTGDITLKGATAQAEQISANVGGNLTVESLQDTATYNQRSKNAGFSVTVGPAPGSSKVTKSSEFRSCAIEASKSYFMHAPSWLPICPWPRLP